MDKAWAKATKAFEEACRKDLAWGRAVAALKVLRPDGQLNDRAWAEQELGAAAAELTGARWAKVRRQLLDRRALTFLDRLHEELAEAEPCPERREAVVALWRRRSVSGKVKVGRGKGGRVNKTREKEGSEGGVGALVLGLVQARLGEGWQASYRRVSRVLGRVVRASSAVECVNSVVRMHQARHRNLSQELLDLKRLFWNCRGFREGKRKGRCPYEWLGLKLPSFEPWDLLQMSPQQLQQILSSPLLAA